MRVAIWLSVVCAFCLALIEAAASPYLAWRQPVYIGAGFAGILAMSLLLVQPLLAAGDVPGVSFGRSRLIHRMVGAALVLLVALHVVGLWITSPPDVLDALLFRSPTTFSPWGVAAMWLVFIAAVLALVRKRIPLRVWRAGHRTLVSLAALASVIHVLLIEGTMGQISKVLLSILVVIAALRVLAGIKTPRIRSRLR